MSRSASKRPVVLIVEDEFLLRMDAASVITAAGFEVVEHRLHGHTRSLENPSAANLAGDALHRRAL